MSVSGWSTFPNLVNLADLSTCNMVIFDQSNDGADDVHEFEALIRKCAGASQSVIAILNPAWTATTDDQVNDPTNESAIGLQIAICDHYGVPYVNGWQMCIDHVNGGGHLSDYFADTAHWNATGHAAVAAAIDALLPSGGIISLPLPARIHTDAEDFENTPVIILGTDYDSRTGTWADNGTSVSSSEVGATITYSGTFRKFGVFRASGAYPNVTVTIDGGAPINNLALYPNGYDIGTRGAHTVVITVTSAVQIDELWAI